MKNIWKQWIIALKKFPRHIMPKFSPRISSEEAEDIAYDWLIQDALGG